MMYATQLDANQPNHYFTALPVRARERQIRAPKKCIKCGMRRVSYSDRVTVYPYNGYIRSTNPIVRHAMSLTCTTKWMRAKQHAPKHATTQPLQYQTCIYDRLLISSQQQYRTAVLVLIRSYEYMYE